MCHRIPSMIRISLLIQVTMQTLLSKFQAEAKTGNLGPPGIMELIDNTFQKPRVR